MLAGNIVGAWPMKISQVTRRNIIDAIAVEKVNWSGRLEEPQFLSRLFHLSDLPSYDRRFKDAAGDIWQHRVNNSDWEDDWVFYDARFDLLNGDDETFLVFLCEAIHPVVQPDPSEAERIRQLYNQYLRNDGFQIIEKSRLSGKPVFIGRYVGDSIAPSLSEAKEAFGSPDPTYVFQQITRMEASMVNDPALAIGTAKEFVETCCKTILEAQGVAFSKSDDLPKLIKLTIKELELTPNDIPDKTKAFETIKRLLGGLAAVVQGITELRNQYGTGHGRAGNAKGLDLRHAKLAVGAASTLAVFLTETHKERHRN